jgi:hypothetical protein
MSFENLTIQNEDLQEFMVAVGDLIADAVTVACMPANVTPAPTAAAWSYTVPFEIRSSTTGNVLPCNGNVAATVGDTSNAGTAAVSTATPTVTMGRGSVVLSGDAADWLDTETATLTITYTNCRGATDVDQFVVTFTA